MISKEKRKKSCIIPLNHSHVLFKRQIDRCVTHENEYDLDTVCTHESV